MSARRLLLVEDDSTMRRMISILLQDAGYAVETAVDGRDGLEKMRANRPDLVLTDFEMPELNGAGLCREMKADKELRSIPVLRLTTVGGADRKAEGLDASIEKPKSPDQIEVLLARIRSALRIADLRSELSERNKLLEAELRKLEFQLCLARMVSWALR